ncbi:MAG TPA: DUF1801 domain-containing protein [Pyrinomonadaceae bacterium]|nr:DUF1801 domain-containing protein [Pyrinomonadaceae bacterium]
MNEVDEYLAAQPDRHRALLERIRAMVKAIVPDAEECISYQIPAFRYKGILCSYAGFKSHVSFFPGKQPIADCADQLRGYKTSAGTVQFPLDAPLPDPIIERMIRICVERNEEKSVRKR